jgi:hypothetical protein
VAGFCEHGKKTWGSIKVGTGPLSASQEEVFVDYLYYFTMLCIPRNSSCIRTVMSWSFLMLLHRQLFLADLHNNVGIYYPCVMLAGPNNCTES